MWALYSMLRVWCVLIREQHSNLRRITLASLWRIDWRKYMRESDQEVVVGFTLRCGWLRVGWWTRRWTAELNFRYILEGEKQDLLWARNEGDKTTEMPPGIFLEQLRGLRSLYWGRWKGRTGFGGQIESPIWGVNETSNWRCQDPSLERRMEIWLENVNLSVFST